ncbi:hypothetical protein GLP02_24880, partial [Escherichia coli]|nr:hypothetical protein [Escherichia coli]
MDGDKKRKEMSTSTPQGGWRQVEKEVSDIDLMSKMMEMADNEKPEILAGENILEVKEPRGGMVEFKRYE